MRFAHLIAAVALSTAVAAPALAEGVSAGLMVRTADGQRLARIDRIVKDASGQPTSASVLYDGRFVYLPYSSLSLGEDGKVVTSLSKQEVRKLR